MIFARHVPNSVAGTKMRLTHAMSLRDGGTTSITVSQGLFRKVSYTVDYSLPWDGRKRFVFRGPPFVKDDAHRLEMDCGAEREIHQWLADAANRRFGQAIVRDFLSDGTKNPGAGKWFYAMNFLKILEKERCQPCAPPNGGPAESLGNSEVTGGPPSVS
jgi:hypothetical protein